MNTKEEEGGMQSDRDGHPAEESDLPVLCSHGFARVPPLSLCTHSC